MTPDERLPFVAQLDAQDARYRSELQALNARIPLSPLVEIDDSVEGYDTDSSDGYSSYGGCPACCNFGGYGDCADHPPSEEQRLNRRAAQLWNRYRRDHPQACGGAVVPVPEQSFPFLDLLSELRTTIYRLLLHRSRA